MIFIIIIILNITIIYSNSNGSLLGVAGWLVWISLLVLVWVGLGLLNLELE